MIQVVQCWDDGVAEDARLADLLRLHKAKATFNINPSNNDRSKRILGWRNKEGREIWRLSLEEMKNVYSGFGVASHTMTHPRPTQIAPEAFRKEAADCRKFIEDFFGREARGFAYPYGDYNEEVKDILREEGFAYARTTKNVENCFPPADPMEFHSNCHFLNPAFWDIFAKAKELGSVFYFWGHSYELDAEEKWDSFDKKIAALNADPDVRWADIIDLFH